MMLVKKYPSIIKIDKASLGAASDAGDVQGLHKGRLGIGREKTVEAMKALSKFRHKQLQALENGWVPGRARRLEAGQVRYGRVGLQGFHACVCSVDRGLGPQRTELHFSKWVPQPSQRRE